MYSWYPPMYWPLPLYWKHIIQGGYTASRVICRRIKKENTQEKTVTPDWLSTHCGLSQNLSLPCNTKFLIIPVNKLCTPRSSKLCTPAILKVNACCLTLAISYFILLFWPLFVPCLFEKFCWEGKRLAESFYFQNHWCAQFNCKKCKSTSSTLNGRLLIYIFNQFLFFLKRCFCVHCDSLSSHISAYRKNQTSPEGFLFYSASSDTSFKPIELTRKIHLIILRLCSHSTGQWNGTSQKLIQYSVTLCCVAGIASFKHGAK